RSRSATAAQFINYKDYGMKADRLFGIIKRFGPDGYGYILREDRTLPDVVFPRGHLRSNCPLLVGQRVSFLLAGSAEHPRAKDVKQEERTGGEQLTGVIVRMVADDHLGRISPLIGGGVAEFTRYALMPGHDPEKGDEVLYDEIIDNGRRIAGNIQLA